MRPAIDLLAVFLARGIAATGGLVISIVVARLGGPSELAALAVFLGLLGLTSSIAKYGEDMILLKTIGRLSEKEKKTSGKAMLFSSARKSVSRMLLVGAIAALLSLSGLHFEFDPTNAVSLGLIVTAIALLSLVSVYFRTMNLSWLSPGFEIGGISLLAALLLLLTLGFGAVLEFTKAFLISTIALLVLAGIIISPRAQDVTGSFTPNAVEQKPVRRAFLLISLATFLTSAGSFVLASPFLEAETIGILRAAERLALLVSFPILAIEPFIQARVVRLYAIGDENGLRRKTFQAMGLGLIIGLIPFSLLVLFPEKALSILGNDFSEARIYLQLLAGTHLVYVALAPMITVINLTDDEQYSMRVNLLSLVLAIFIFPFGCIVFGASGFIGAYILTMMARIVAVSFRVLKYRLFSDLVR